MALTALPAAAGQAFAPQTSSVDQRVGSISSNVAGFLGYESDQLINMSMYELVHPDDLQHVLRVHLELMQQKSNSPMTASYRLRRKDNQFMIVEALFFLEELDTTGQLWSGMVESQMFHISCICTDLSSLLPLDTAMGPLSKTQAMKINLQAPLNAMVDSLLGEAASLRAAITDKNNEVTFLANQIRKVLSYRAWVMKAKSDSQSRTSEREPPAPQLQQEQTDVLDRAHQEMVMAAKVKTNLPETPTSDEATTRVKTSLNGASPSTSSASSHSHPLSRVGTSSATPSPPVTSAISGGTNSMVDGMVNVTVDGTVNGGRSINNLSASVTVNQQPPLLPSLVTLSQASTSSAGLTNTQSNAVPSPFSNFFAGMSLPVPSPSTSFPFSPSSSMSGLFPANVPSPQQQLPVPQPSVPQPPSPAFSSGPSFTMPSGLSSIISAVSWSDGNAFASAAPSSAGPSFEMYTQPSPEFLLSMYGPHVTAQAKYASGARVGGGSLMMPPSPSAVGPSPSALGPSPSDYRMAASPVSSMNYENSVVPSSNGLSTLELASARLGYNAARFPSGQTPHLLQDQAPPSFYPHLQQLPHLARPYPPQFGNHLMHQSPKRHTVAFAKQGNITNQVDNHNEDDDDDDEDEDDADDDGEDGDGDDSADFGPGQAQKRGRRNGMSKKKYRRSEGQTHKTATTNQEDEANQGRSKKPVHIGPRGGRRERKLRRPPFGDHCAECPTTMSSEWRKGPDPEKLLCNACGLRYNRKCRKMRQQGNPES